MTIYDPNPLDLFASRRITFRVNHMYNFTNSEGLEGTIQMLAFQEGGEMHIRSLRGTGDFQNVQIQATLDELGSHTGVVIGCQNKIIKGQLVLNHRSSFLFSFSP